MSKRPEYKLARKGEFQALKILYDLAKKETPNHFFDEKNPKRFFDIDSAVCGACAGGHLSILKFFISKADGLDDVYNNKIDAFYEGCVHGHFPVVEFLIPYGTLQGNYFWNQGLRGACLGGQFEMAKFLVSKGANLWQAAFPTNIDKYLPFDKHGKKIYSKEKYNNCFTIANWVLETCVTPEDAETPGDKYKHLNVYVHEMYWFALFGSAHKAIEPGRRALWHDLALHLVKTLNLTQDQSFFKKWDCKLAYCRDMIIHCLEAGISRNYLKFAGGIKIHVYNKIAQFQSAVQRRVQVFLLPDLVSIIISYSIV